MLLRAASESEVPVRRLAVPARLRPASSLASRGSVRGRTARSTSSHAPASCVRRAPMPRPRPASPPHARVPAPASHAPSHARANFTRRPRPANSHRDVSRETSVRRAQHRRRARCALALASLAPLALPSWPTSAALSCALSPRITDLKRLASLELPAPE